MVCGMVLGFSKGGGGQTYLLRCDNFYMVSDLSVTSFLEKRFQFLCQAVLSLLQR